MSPRLESTHRCGGFLGVPLHCHKLGQQMFPPAFSDDGGPEGGALALAPDQLTHLAEDSWLKQDVKTAFRVR